MRGLWPQGRKVAHIDLPLANCLRTLGLKPGAPGWGQAEVTRSTVEGSIARAWA